MKMTYPILETERLVMHELTLSDAEAVYNHFANPDVVRFMDIEVCKDLSEAEEIISFHIQDSGCRYGLFHKENGELIGTCGFHCWYQSELRAEIGFDLSPSYWGKGIVQEALTELIPVGFAYMKLDLIEATTELENVNSQRLLRKMGFIQATELKDNLLYYRLKRT